MTALPANPYLAVRQAFDAPWPGPRGEMLRLAAGSLSATLCPADGGRLVSLAAGGVELLRPWTPERRAFQYGCFPMIPWVGRLREGRLGHAGQTHVLPVNKPPHALHGMACFAPWEVVDADGQSALLRFGLTKPWPWPGEVTQRVTLRPEALEMTLTVAARDVAFPAAAGWHPWFRKWLGAAGESGPVPPGEEATRLRVDFAADWQEEPGTDELPTGRRIPPRPGPWDDCFGFANRMQARLLWPDRLVLDMGADVASMVVFDKQPDATCVEPLSGPPDGVNTAPRLVLPGAPLMVRTQWVIKGTA
ncbi:Aldose 1-epimerase [Rhodovastum atsumiense]|uniref:Aldose 1-epimerase n=1 Tax=Rhodovastum atsumiense TaxID=504468 RepID=A0A5M6IV21_9PROT|nr:aldose 1-epimerase [Rhodovastum atsumiense]KAA5612160.1 aldose 1-epimerase [Rhodovastum atsumiense]CAH2603893.1 Aldose 1-epimerase [Rhodovastum atsumiense]